MWLVLVVNGTGANHRSSSARFVWQSHTRWRRAANSRFIVSVLLPLSARNSNRRSDLTVFSFEFCQQAFEIAVPALPEQVLLAEPALGGDQAFAIERACPHPPAFAGRDQPRFFEHADVLHE